ncbi:MAG: hypothetical protein Q7S16_02105 [bacterium]|nr:hypothetical protein [bacterium]
MDNLEHALDRQLAVKHASRVGITVLIVSLVTSPFFFLAALLNVNEGKGILFVFFLLLSPLYNGLTLIATILSIRKLRRQNKIGDRQVFSRMTAYCILPWLIGANAIYLLAYPLAIIYLPLPSFFIVYFVTRIMTRSTSFPPSTQNNSTGNQ